MIGSPPPSAYPTAYHPSLSLSLQLLAEGRGHKGEVKMREVSNEKINVSLASNQRNVK